MEQESDSANAPDSQSPARTQRGHFVRGISGNPSGRPKSPPDRVKRIARRFTRRMVGVLVSIAEDAKAPHRERHRAAETVLAYGYGRPPTTQEVIRPAAVGVSVSVGMGAPAQGATWDTATAYRLMCEGVLAPDPGYFDRQPVTKEAAVPYQGPA